MKSGNIHGEWKHTWEVETQMGIGIYIGSRDKHGEWRDRQNRDIYKKKI